MNLYLVIPCYNEAARLLPDAFLDLVSSSNDIALLFVDDGSRDQTPAILANLVSRSAGKASLLTLPGNVGKAEAVRRGFLEAFKKGPECVGYWDADLATPLTAVGDFLEVLRSNSQVDIVIGSRVKLLGRRIRRSAIRHYCGRVFATAASVALQVGVYDTQCGAKLFRANDSVRAIFAAPFQSTWVVDVEILARYIDAVGPDEAERRICEVPLMAWTDVPGSKLSVRHAVRALWDLVVIARRTRAENDQRRAR